LPPFGFLTWYVANFNCYISEIFVFKQFSSYNFTFKINESIGVLKPWTLCITYNIFIKWVIFTRGLLYLWYISINLANLVLCFILTINWFMWTLFRGVLIMTFGGYIYSLLTLDLDFLLFYCLVCYFSINNYSIHQHICNFFYNKKKFEQIL
jgi:hypothetical protein